MEPKIVNCRISDYPRPMPEGMFDPMPQVWVTLETGEEKKLFEFYPDEIDFSPNEFIGLTETEARELRVKKDMLFLQS